VTFSKLKPYLPRILSIAAWLVFIAYLYRSANRYGQLLTLSPGLLFLSLGLVLTVIFGNGLTNYLLYRGLGVRLTVNEGIGLGAVNSLANQFLSGGGMVAKGIYLKGRYELTYTRFLSATLALYIFFLAANGIVGIAVLVYLALMDDAVVPMPLILGFSGMAVTVSLLWLPLDASSVSGKWGQRLAQLLDGWQILNQNRPLLGKLVGIRILMILISAGRYFIAFHILSQDVTLAQCILFSSASILTRLVAITPGGLGVHEAIVTGVAFMFGFEAGVSIVAVGIDRLIATVVILSLGTVYTYILSKKTTNSHPETRPARQP